MRGLKKNMRRQILALPEAWNEVNFLLKLWKYTKIVEEYWSEIVNANYNFVSKNCRAIHLARTKDMKQETLLKK